MMRRRKGSTLIKSMQFQTRRLIIRSFFMFVFLTGSMHHLLPDHSAHSHFTPLNVCHERTAEAASAALQRGEDPYSFNHSYCWLCQLVQLGFSHCAIYFNDKVGLPDFSSFILSLKIKESCCLLFGRGPPLYV